VQGEGPPPIAKEQGARIRFAAQENTTIMLKVLLEGSHQLAREKATNSPAGFRLVGPDLKLPEPRVRICFEGLVDLRRPRQLGRHFFHR
jgi:hypothetical protein